MSVYGALFSGASGLAANSSALGMLADNIANVNTIGYKGTNPRFSTLVTESTAVASYSPGGVIATPQSLISQQGLLQGTESPTDLAIIGSGFFVVGQDAEPGLNADNVVFTRAGSFTPDAEGFLRNTAGHYLKGWAVNSVGGIPTNLGDLTALQTVNVTGLTGTAEATTLVDLRANLQSSQAVSAAEATYDPTVAGTNMASGAVTPDFLRTVEVFDSQGGTHTLAMAMLKDNVANQWHVEIYAIPAADVAIAPPLIDGQLATGTLAFNTDGTFNLAGTTAALTAAIPATWTNGAAPSAVTLDFGSDGKGDGFTQFDSSSTLISSSVNGAVFGNVVGVQIGTDGIVSALFDNGLIKDVFQLPIATFSNPDGLLRLNGNAFRSSNQSGEFSMQIPGNGGAGRISPSALEASTVDLAEEFTKLITTQRAFTAATRIITTADEMLDELNRIKR